MYPLFLKILASSNAARYISDRPEDFKEFRSNKRKKDRNIVLDRQAAVQLALCDSPSLLATF
jgi:hypothetical protein